MEKIETELEKDLFWAIHSWRETRGWLEWEKINMAKAMAKDLAPKWERRPPTKSENSNA